MTCPNLLTHSLTPCCCCCSVPCADASGLAGVDGEPVVLPEGGTKLLEVEATLTALHSVTHPAPGVTKKTLQKPTDSFMKPTDGSTVTVKVEARGSSSAATDGAAVVYEPTHEVELVLDEEQVGVRVCVCVCWLVGGWVGGCVEGGI